MKRRTKSNCKKLLAATPGFLELAAWFTRYTPKIFMLHRFCRSLDENKQAMSGPAFEKQLRFLKRRRLNVITLGQYLALRKNSRPVPPYTVILTIDDGYGDFFDVAYPLLMKYDLRATFFVTSGFVEGDCWLWHDRIDYALRNTKKDGFEIDFQNEKRFFHLRSEQEILSTWQVFSDYCISVPNSEKWHLIEKIEKIVDVSIPEKVPHDYAAATWSQLREMAENGIEIGAHSVTHPILSKISPARLEEEIAGSKKAIEANIDVPVDSFCYPNGREGDINRQVVQQVQRAGFSGATYGSRLDFSDIYRLPRMGIGNDMLDFKWKISGLEMLLNRHDM